MEAAVMERPVSLERTAKPLLRLLKIRSSPWCPMPVSKSSERGGSLTGVRSIQTCPSRPFPIPTRMRTHKVRSTCPGRPFPNVAQRACGPLQRSRSMRRMQRSPITALFGKKRPMDTSISRSSKCSINRNRRSIVRHLRLNSATRRITSPTCGTNLIGMTKSWRPTTSVRALWI